MYSEARDYWPLIGIDSQAYSARADVVFSGCVDGLDSRAALCYCS